MAVMKSYGMKAVARVLIVAYGLFLLKPVMPIIVDALAHTFWRSVHVAVVHRVNGKEHVHYELRKAAADLEKDKAGHKQSNSVEQDIYSLPSSLTAGELACYAFAIDKPTAYYHPAQYRADISRNYPPPKLAHQSAFAKRCCIC